MPLLAGLAYTAIGRFFPNPAIDPFWWRLGAWVLCAIVFGAHFALEHRKGAPAWRVARSVAIGTAIGGLGLAASAMVFNAVHGRARTGAWALALVLWPLILAVPGFVIGYLGETLLQRFNPEQ